MASRQADGTIVTQIPRTSTHIDNTRIGWPSSSLVSVFNRNGGPSAAAELHGTVEPSVEADAPKRYPGEVAELIDHAILPLGYVPQRDPVAADPDAISGKDGSEAEALASSAKAVEHAADGPASMAPIEVVEMRRCGSRLGRFRIQERYPFDTIAVVEDCDGKAIGESFFIPDADRPRRQLARARKRYKPKGFSARRDNEKGGYRVWRFR